LILKHDVFILECKDVLIQNLSDFFARKFEILATWWTMFRAYDFVAKF